MAQRRPARRGSAPGRKGPAAASERVPKERVQFRRLLAENANYFGNLVESPIKPIKKMVGNTTYEELTCTGYNPEKGLLEATIQIKGPTGYNGDLCHEGSTEYVRFFVDDGSGWQDAGLAGVKVHDIPSGQDCAGQPNKPLSYVATLSYQPKGDCCDEPLLPNVRAILSWQWVPPAGNPGWLPPWGNRLECHVQIKPRPWTLSCLFDDLEIEIPELFESVKELPIPQPDPPPFKLAELAEMYSSKKGATKAAKAQLSVEPHRFGVADIHKALTAGSFDEELFASKQLEWSGAGLDWANALQALEKTSADVSYEELECLGLDEVFPERLVASFRIKRAAGYSGDLCNKGSYEYVAFWADWDNTCEWTYLGTQAVNVHDIASIPTDGLCYSAFQPVDLSKHRRSCETPTIGRVRAVLSWSVPPSTIDPDELEYYGNRVDTHVLVEPKEVGDPNNARIRNIGGIAVEDIDTDTSLGNGMTKSIAFGGGSVRFAHTPGNFADGWGLDRECPFGGTIWIEGVDFFWPNYYRVRVRKHLDTSVVNALTGDFYVERTGPGYDHQVASGEWFQYLPGSYMNRLLAYWSSSGDEPWEVQLDIASAPNEASIISSSDWYLIQLDNTAPQGPPAVPLTMDIHLTAAGGSPLADCKDVEEGDTITGTFIADDLHFGGWSLSTEPNTVAFPSNAPEVTGLLNTDPAPGPGGQTWTLHTAPPPAGLVTMKPCGYVVRLDVSDRTIAHSVPFSHNSNHIEVGFCLREKKKKP